ncbi:unnamed protein product, partial [Sphagnum compactum]
MAHMQKLKMQKHCSCSCIFIQYLFVKFRDVRVPKNAFCFTAFPLVTFRLVAFRLIALTSPHMDS